MTPERLAEIRRTYVELQNDEPGYIASAKVRELLAEVERLSGEFFLTWRARAGAHWLGVLGAALAGPAATECAAREVDGCDYVPGDASAEAIRTGGYKYISPNDL